MSIYEIDVNSLPVSTNRLYINIGRGGAKALSKEAKDFEFEVQEKVKMMMRSKDKKEIKIEKNEIINAEISVYSPKFRTLSGGIAKVDLDNYAKNAIDAFSRALGIDDKCIFSVKMNKVFSAYEYTNMVFKIERLNNEHIQRDRDIRLLIKSKRNLPKARLSNNLHSCRRIGCGI